MKKLSEEAKQDIFDSIKESNPDALFADGLEDALIGIHTRFNQPLLAAYSVSKVLQIFHDRDGMSYDEAREFYDFNVIGAWMGDGTPVFIEDQMV